MANNSKSSSKLKLLYAEGDPEVLAEQSVTLEQAGHQVTRVETRAQAQDLLKRETFDLVILGATLSKNDRHHLAYMVKKANRNTRVLATHTDGEGHHAVDANVETGSSMRAVLEKIAALYPQAAGAASGR